MSELKEILWAILMMIYGAMAYVIGRTNFLEKVIIDRLLEFLDSVN